MKKLLGAMCLIIFTVSLSIGGYMVIDRLREYKESDDLYDETAYNTVNRSEVKAKNSLEKPAAYENGVTIDWEELAPYKEDVKAWIMLGEDINYPVMQAKDNSYYLHRTYQKKKNFAGCIFMNCDNAADFSDPNTIVYGHNMKNGSMFGKLKRYKKKDYGDRYFYIYLPDGRRRTYQIFSVAEVKDAGKAYQYSFMTEEDYIRYQEYVKTKSTYDTGVSIDSSKRVCTMSTCRSSGSNKGWRVIVVGMEIDTSKVQEPASWYEEEPEVDLVDIENPQS